jgi:hypothetical protein
MGPGVTQDGTGGTSGSDGAPPATSGTVGSEDDGGTTAVGGSSGDGGTAPGSSDGADTGDDGGRGSRCDASPGAQDGATMLGPTVYDGPGTTMVSNVIFDGEHGDDLVRVYNGHVIFDHVTFRGTGIGDTGHTLEIKQGGSAEVHDSVFEGSPSEDTIQTQLNGPTTIVCNVFASSPGEDHIDTKPGASVTVELNEFMASPSAQTIQNHNGSGSVDLIDNTGLERIFYEDGATGVIRGNAISVQLWLYDVEAVLVEDNEIAFVKHGEGSSDRDPVDTYFLNNVIADAQDGGGTCYRDGNSGGAPVEFCMPGPPDWYEP